MDVMPAVCSSVTAGMPHVQCELSSGSTVQTGQRLSASCCSHSVTCSLQFLVIPAQERNQKTDNGHLGQGPGEGPGGCPGEALGGVQGRVQARVKGMVQGMVQDRIQD